MIDLISRQGAIDAITAIDEGCNMDIFTNEVREILRDLPSVQSTADVAPVVHGRWVLKRFSEREHDVGTVCSACKQATIFRTDYCPHCGAKMDGGEGV